MVEISIVLGFILAVILVMRHAVKRGTKDPASPSCYTTLEIAELLGKKHFHVMRDVRKYVLDWDDFVNGVDEGLFPNANGRTVVCYVLTRPQAMELANIYKDTLLKTYIDGKV